MLPGPFVAWAGDKYTVKVVAHRPPISTTLDFRHRNVDFMLDERPVIASGMRYDVGERPLYRLASKRGGRKEAGKMDILSQTTLVLMLVAYIAGLITAMILLAPRYRP